MNHNPMKSSSSSSSSADFWAGREVDEYETTQRLMVEQKQEVLANTARIVDYFCRQKLLSFPDILDVGCGTGNLAGMLLERIEDCRVVGVDASEEMLEVFRRDCAARFPDRAASFLVDFNRQDFWNSMKDTKYDAIVSSMALHYLSDETAPRFFKEVRSHLKERGLFVACIGNLSAGPEIRNMEYQFKLEFAYRHRKENGYSGTFLDFKNDFEKRTRKMDIHWRPPKTYIDLLEAAGFREVDIVWHLWIKSIYVALR